MKKHYALSLLLTLAALPLYRLCATPIDSLRASRVAVAFLSRYVADANQLQFSTKNTAPNGKVRYYVFNLKKGNGYVIVSADDACLPILGYSTESRFFPENVPVQLNKILWHRAREIGYIQQKGFGADEDIRQAWQEIEHPGNAVARTTGNNAVAPLVATRWDQSPYYNDLCPQDPKATADDGNRVVSGCVATAMAQLMKYHNHPKTGQGIYSYVHEKYGRLSADFGSTTYQWAAMPNRVTSRNTAVATLMYHCGVSLDMNYDIGQNGGSSASTAQVSNVLKKYFGYATSAKYVEKKDYSEAAWTALLKTELDAKRPLQYRGQGTGGGHSFVCDGYDDNSFFHMNWGWGGNSDNYMNLRALNPGSLGTGGGEGGFNSSQGAVIGIQPAGVTATPNLQVYKRLTISPTPLDFGDDLTVSLNIVNRGTASFQGDYAVALFDKDLDFISFVGQPLTNYTLSAGNVYVNDLTFTQKKLFLSEGEYVVAAYFRETGKEWQLLNKAGFENPVKIQVAPVEADLTMYGTPLRVSSSPMYQNSAVDVTFNIANFGTTPFEGDLSVRLYDLEGNFVKEIENRSLSLGANKTFTNPLVYNTTRLDVAPGTYLLAPVYKPKSGTSFYVLAARTDGSTTYPNLLRVVVATPPLLADRFEVNDRENQAASLPVSFSGNSAPVNTEGTNLHVGTDLDFFKLDLPGGFLYEVTARVHDSDNSGNGKTYSGDVVFSYKAGSGSYSEAFDVSVNEVNDKIALSNGGSLIFKVAPYNAGEKGTYLLDIRVIRKEQPYLRLSAPAAGDKWMMTTTQRITWTDNLDEPVLIALLRGTSNTPVQTITASTPSNGQFSWTIPANLPEASDYKIGIASTLSSSIQAVSGAFTIVPLPTGLEDEAADVRVYPNPATRSVTVDWPATATVRAVTLRDATGKLLRLLDAPPGTHRHELDVSAYPAGLYLLRVERAEGTVLKKITLLR